MQKFKQIVYTKNFNFVFKLFLLSDFVFKLFLLSNVPLLYDVLPNTEPM